MRSTHPAAHSAAQTHPKVPVHIKAHARSGPPAPRRTGRPRLANLAAAAWLIAGLVAIPAGLLVVTAPVEGGVTIAQGQ